MTIKCSEFVKRQTKDSRFSHFIGTWEELEDIAVINTWRDNPYSNVRPGYKNGVILVAVPPGGFRCGVIRVTEDTEFKVTYEPRRQGENPFINISATGEKSQAKYVDLVLYSREVLGLEASTDADWEIVSINARMQAQEDPMDPVTMMRNFLELPGGTKGEFSAQQFAESILFWSQHALCHQNPK